MKKEKSKFFNLRNQANQIDKSQDSSVSSGLKQEFTLDKNNNNFIAGENCENVRIDKFLCNKFSIPFALSQRLIREKKVKINNLKVDASYRIKPFDDIKIFTNLTEKITETKKTKKISKQKIDNFLSNTIYEDDNLFAVNKPEGLATQGGSGIEISVDDIISAINDSFQLVHRLDKDTSGVLLIAKNKKTAEFLTKSFKEKTISKTYVALVCGVVKKKDGVINIPLRKKFVGKNEKVYPDFEAGKEAITNFKLKKIFYDYSLLEVKPITGRTHQIRVHCKEMGHPIVNDIKYGGLNSARSKIKRRLCLHAYKIKISNYRDEDLTIETKYPDFF